MNITVRIVALVFTLAFLAMTVAVMINGTASILTLVALAVVALFLIGIVASTRHSDDDS